MPIVLRYTEKDPAEICSVSLDFTPAMASGETPTSTTLAVFTNTNPPVATNDIGVVGTSVSGNVAIGRIVGGKNGVDYLLQFTVNTSLGNVVPRSVQLLVGATS